MKRIGVFPNMELGQEKGFPGFKRQFYQKYCTVYFLGVLKFTPQYSSHSNYEQRNLG